MGLIKKSGCFLNFIILLTIFIGILFYIGKKYGPEWLEIGKEKIFQLAENDIQDRLEKLEENNYKDSLIVLVDDHIAKIKELNLDDLKESDGEFIEKIDEFLEDNIINSEEFFVLKGLFKKYER